MKSRWTLFACLTFVSFAHTLHAYTISLPAGFSLVANQALNSRCFDAFTWPGFDGLTIYRWNRPTGGYLVDSYVDGAWEGDSGGTAPCFLYGESFWIQSPIAFNLTIPGPPNTPSLPLTTAAFPVIQITTPGFYFLGRQTNAVGTFENIVGFPPSSFNPVQFYRYDVNSLFNLNGIPVSAFSYQNNKWSPYTPELNEYGGNWSEGAILKFAQVPSGPPPACALSGVVPNKVCRGGSVLLRVYGMGIPSPLPPGAKIRLSKGNANYDSGPINEDDPGYVVSGTVFIPPGAIAANDWIVSVRDSLNALLCPYLGSPDPAGYNNFVINAQNCSQPALTVQLFGLDKIAPSVVNSFGLYYKNNGSALVGGKVYITCLPDDLLATVSSPTPGAIVNSLAGQAPCAGSGSQSVTLNMGAVGAGASGYLVIDMSTTLPVGSTFCIEARGFRNNVVLQDQDSLCVTVVASQDPNDKAGLPGVGVPRYISGNETMPYLVRFENMSTATAPAQDVTIIDPLDPLKLDLSTFSLGPMFFGSHVVTPPPGVMSHSVDVPYDVDGNPVTTADDIIVRIRASLNTDLQDPNFGTATWTFRSIDPVTGLRPIDPMRGFLPPNLNPPQGQGGIYFSIDPHGNLTGGDTITNGASIVFDANAPINTAVWLNTIDLTEAELQIRKDGDEAVVSWTGNGILQSTADLMGEWENMATATTPFREAITGQKFFRLKQ